MPQPRNIIIAPSKQGIRAIGLLVYMLLGIARIAKYNSSGSDLTIQAEKAASLLLFGIALLQIANPLMERCEQKQHHKKTLQEALIPPSRGTPSQQKAQALGFKSIIFFTASLPHAFANLGVGASGALNFNDPTIRLWCYTAAMATDTAEQIMLSSNARGFFLSAPGQHSCYALTASFPVAALALYNAAILILRYAQPTIVNTAIAAANATTAGAQVTNLQQYILGSDYASTALLILPALISLLACVNGCRDLSQPRADGHRVATP